MRIPIGDDITLCSTSGTNQGGVATSSKVWTFTNKDKIMANAQSTSYNTSGDKSILIGYIKYVYIKQTKVEFLSDIENLWSNNQVQ